PFGVHSSRLDAVGPASRHPSSRFSGMPEQRSHACFGRVNSCRYHAGLPKTDSTVVFHNPEAPRTLPSCNAAIHKENPLTTECRVVTLGARTAPATPPAAHGSTGRTVTPIR